MKRRQLNTPRWRSKLLFYFLSFFFFFLTPTASSLPLTLPVSFSLPHSLFEEVRFSLSLLFSPVAADEPQLPWLSPSVEAAPPLCVCGRCCGAVGDDWQQVRPMRKPNTLFVAAPVSCCWSIFCFFHRGWDCESLSTNELTVLFWGFFIKHLRAKWSTRHINTF